MHKDNHVTTFMLATANDKHEIEQNRCAMACQGCGAVFYFF